MTLVTRNRAVPAGIHRMEGQTGEIPTHPAAKIHFAGNLAAIGSRLVAGRDMTWSEIYSRALGATISEDLARELSWSRRPLILQARIVVFAATTAA